jgi:hypothetical protein
MRSRPQSLFPGLPASSRARSLLLGAALLAISATVLACFGGDDDDDDDADATQASGSVATATATTAEANATPTPQRVGGTLVPLNTATPAPSVTTSAGGALPPLETVAMIDMAPCSDKTYFEAQSLGERVPVLTYKDVPEGTPILFPFEEGRLIKADARDGAILLFFEVDDVGIFSVQAAGSESLDRTLGEVVKGSVIGHFEGVFDEESTDAFEGYQLFAVIGDTTMTQIGETIYAGQAIEPNVTDCLILP